MKRLLTGTCLGDSYVARTQATEMKGTNVIDIKIFQKVTPELL